MKEVIFWILIGILVLWVILKLAGVIHFPVYFEILPATVIIGVFICLHVDLKSSYNKLSEYVDKKMEILSQRIDKNNEIIVQRIDDMISIFKVQTGNAELLMDLTKE